MTTQTDVSTRKTRLRGLRLFLPLAALITAVAVLPAQSFAAQPSAQTVSGSFSEVVPADQSPCGFALLIETSGTVTIRIYYDQSGSPVREFIYRPVIHTFSSLDDQGNVVKSISARGPAPATIDPTTGLQTSTGDQMIFTLPGQGVIFGQAGHFVYGDNNTAIVSSSGLDIQNLGALCAALAP